MFWRDFDSNRGQNQSDPDGKPEGRPQHKELCPISISQAKDIHKRKRGAWYWDTLGDSKRKKNGQWVKLDRAPRPGMTLLLCTQDGGYDLKVGFDASLKKKTVPVVVDLREKPTEEDAFTNDQRSHQKKPVDLVEHLGNVAREAKTLCEALDETNYREAVIRAARWHDLGKAHPVFQATMHACAEAPQGLLAKSPCDGRHERPFFRHELASMLGWLAQHGVDPEADLIAYLVLAHHGKVRTSLRAMPAEKPGKGVSRFARGIWEGDTLPALTFDGEHSAELTLKLALMELGEGEQGRSWSERALTLLKDHGPFRLAWLETLVRLADWRASAEEQRE